MDIIKTKRILIFAVSIVFIYLLAELLLTFINSPKIETARFESLSISEIKLKQVMDSNDSVNQIPFNYQLIGFRANIEGPNSSVIVKRNNSEFVIQKGDFLEGKYKLIEVGRDKAIFENNGQQYQLSIEVK